MHKLIRDYKDDGYKINKKQHDQTNWRRLVLTSEQVLKSVTKLQNYVKRIVPEVIKTKN